MQTLRRLALTHRRLAMLLLVLALLIKAVVPAGYMPAFTGKVLTVAMCNGAGPVTISIPVTSTGHGDADHKGANDHPCAFSALGGDSLAAADPVQLAVAIAFAFLLALFALQLPPVRREHHLRPPLRGPPAAA